MILTCTSCKKDYPATNEFFYYRKDRDRFQYHECKACFKARINKRAQEQKHFCLSMKGGKCEKCGYDKCIAALEFHHVDRTTKEFRLSKSFLSKEKLISELKKCILLCSNCHREIHYEESQKKLAERLTN